MLIEFSVANFRSILTRQTLSMVAGPDAGHLGGNVIQTGQDELRLLRSAVIYGPNAAGKSNVLRALETFRQIVIRSATTQTADQPIPVTPFLLTAASAEAPTEFDLIFIADDGVRYHYSVEVSRKRVVKEWLVAYPRGRAQRWFERSFDIGKEAETWWFGSKFKAKRSERKVWQDFTAGNVLFLSNAIKLNNAQLRPVFDWIAQKLIVLIPGIAFNPFLNFELLKEEMGHDKIMRFMRAADIGIDRLELREEDLPVAGALQPGGLRVNVEIGLPPGVEAGPSRLMRVLAWHKRLDSDEPIALDLNDESEGTRKLFAFTGGWLRALEGGATLFVDELDSSLHPHMTRFLVNLFHSQANDKNAQLVFTTHDTTLLDNELLRRDQIWFVEKDAQHASHLYSLLEYSPRKDEALERGYLKGRYGAIPFIGKLDG